jgi:hypothetical protein
MPIWLARPWNKKQTNWKNEGGKDTTAHAELCMANMNSSFVTTEDSVYNLRRKWCWSVAALKVDNEQITPPGKHKANQIVAPVQFEFEYRFQTLGVHFIRPESREEHQKDQTSNFDKRSTRFQRNYTTHDIQSQRRHTLLQSINTTIAKHSWMSRTQFSQNRNRISTADLQYRWFREYYIIHK